MESVSVLAPKHTTLGGGLSFIHRTLNDKVKNNTHYNEASIKNGIDSVRTALLIKT